MATRARRRLARPGHGDDQAAIGLSTLLVDWLPCWRHARYTSKEVDASSGYPPYTGGLGSRRQRRRYQTVGSSESRHGDRGPHGIIDTYGSAAVDLPIGVGDYATIRHRPCRDATQGLCVQRCSHG